MAVETGLNRSSGATEPKRTGPLRFGCGPQRMGNGLDRLRSTVAHFGVKKPDLTGLENTIRLGGNTRVLPVHQHFD
jgi:hypothetical protein